MLTDLPRWIGSTLFGFKYVELRDFDGEIHIRRAQVQNGKWGAWRFPMKIYWVYICANGVVTDMKGNSCYVKSWRRYIPFSAPPGFSGIDC